MSIAAVNLSYIGQPSVAAQGQVVASNDSGPLGKVVVGIGTAVLDGAATTFTLNWIDGVQKIFQNQVQVPFFAVTAPATIGGVANQAVYSSVGATGQFRVGQSVVIAGFANSGNNGTFTINGVTTTSVTVTNASSVAETNYQASGVVNLGAVLPAVQVTRSQISAANVADTAASTTTAVPSAITSTGCTITISAAGSAAQTLSVLAELFSVV